MSAQTVQNAGGVAAGTIAAARSPVGESDSVHKRARTRSEPSSSLVKRSGGAGETRRKGLTFTLGSARNDCNHEAENKVRILCSSPYLSRTTRNVVILNHRGDMWARVRGLKDGMGRHREGLGWEWASSEGSFVDVVSSKILFCQRFEALGD